MGAILNMRAGTPKKCHVNTQILTVWLQQLTKRSRPHWTYKELCTDSTEYDACDSKGKVPRQHSQQE